MAFQKKIGNLPILASAYNVAMPTGNVITNYGVNVIQTLINAGYTDDASRINAIHTYGKSATTGAGSNQIIIPCKPKASLTPAQATSVELYNSEDTGTLCRIKYKANIVLDYAETGNGLNMYHDFPFYDFFGVALYSDALGENLVGVQICAAYFRSNLQNIYYDNAYGSISIAELEARGYEFAITSSDPDYGDESEPDGYGDGGTPDFDHTSDVISVPSDPTVSTGSVGFMNVYKVGQGALSGLGQYLFPSFDPSTLTDIVAVLRAIAGIFAYQDSIQYIVDLHAIPVNPTAGASKYIKLGALETDISQPTCASDYVNYDCGSVSIPERFRNFLDYIGVSCKIFIPFIGFVDLAPEYWNGGTIGLKYKFNVIDGSFMAYLVSTSSKSNLANTVIGQYSGNACLHLPVVAASYGAIVGGLVQGSMALAGAPSAPSGNIGKVATGALTASNFQPKMSQSNSYSGAGAFLGGRRPYLLIEYTVQSFSAKYPEEQGLPLNVVASLGSVRGFTVVENPHLKLTCTDEEKTMIENYLKTGVIF